MRGRTYDQAQINNLTKSGFFLFLSPIFYIILLLYTIKSTVFQSLGTHPLSLSLSPSLSHASTHIYCRSGEGGGNNLVESGERDIECLRERTKEIGGEKGREGGERGVEREERGGERGERGREGGERVHFFLHSSFSSLNSPYLAQNPSLRFLLNFPLSISSPSSLIKPTLSLWRPDLQ